MLTASILASLALASQEKLELPAVLTSDCESQMAVPMEAGPTKTPVPMIKVEIAGKARKMLVDTGASGSVVFRSLIQELHLKRIGRTTADDTTKSNTRSVDLYRIPELRIGKAKFYGVLVFAPPGLEDDKSVRAAIGDGVLSFAVFRDQLLTLDYLSSKVRFGPGSLPEGAPNYELVGGTPLIPVKIGKAVVPCQVDSGSNAGLVLPLKFKDSLPIVGEPKTTGHIRTLFNSTELFTAKIDAPVEFAGLSVAMPEIDLRDLFQRGNLGGAMLKDYRVAIDQRSKRITFTSQQ